MNSNNPIPHSKKPEQTRLRRLFQVDKAIGISKFRLYLLRFFYLVNAIFLGSEVWMEIFSHKAPWESLPGVAYSFWAAFSLLAILGIFNPLRMLPVLLIQFTYKLIWLIIVAYPLWTANQLSGSSAHELAAINFKGIIVDLLVIPWPYVFQNYFLRQKKLKV